MEEAKKLEKIIETEFKEWLRVFNLPGQWDYKIRLEKGIKKYANEYYRLTGHKYTRHHGN